MLIKKKRIIVFLLFVLMMIAIFVLPVSAADVYFTVINDNLPEQLSSATMPVELNGIVYVPYSIFNNRDELGTQCFKTKNGAFVMMDKKWLAFYAETGITQDHEDNKYEYKAIIRKGEIFLPAYEVCKFFDLTYSKITSSDVGIIIRIKKGNVLDDEIYVNAAYGNMKQYLKIYLNASTSPGVPTPIVSSAPIDKRNVEAYIAVYGLDGGEEDGILWQLDVYKYKACFFVTAEEIKKYPSQIRKIIGTGHRIGLLLGEDIHSDYKEASEYLRSVANTKTILAAYLGTLNEETRALADEMGIVFWFDDSCRLYSANDSFELSELMDMLENEEDRLDLLLLAEDAVTGGLDDILSDLQARKYNVKKIRETETTCLEYKNR